MTGGAAVHLGALTVGGWVLAILSLAAVVVVAWGIGPVVLEKAGRVWSTGTLLLRVLGLPTTRTSPAE